MATASFPPQLDPDLIRSAIRQVRGNQKQEYCAEKVGYSRRQWIRWESGDSVPSQRALEVIKENFPTFQVTHVTRCHP